MSLQTRVKALVSGSGGADCPECGWDGITPLNPSLKRGTMVRQKGTIIAACAGEPSLSH
jgi:hypothetical protein